MARSRRGRAEPPCFSLGGRVRLERFGGVEAITQGLLGAALGALLLGPRLGRAALGWGLLFGLAPEVERLILPFVDTVWDWKIARGFTHSALVAAAVSAALARALARRWKRQKVTPKQAGWTVFAVLAAHALLDACTIDGAWLGWPLGGHVSFAALPAFDPLLSVPLAVAAVVALRVEPKAWKKGAGRRAAAIGVAVAAAYVGLAFGAKQLVSRQLAADLDRRGIARERHIEMPEFYSILLWRGVIERETEFWVGYRSVFDGDARVTWTIYPKGGGFGELADDFEVRALEKVARGWCLGRPTRRGVWLVDLRVVAARRWDERGVALRPPRAWEYQTDGRGDPLKPTLRRDPGGREMARRMAARMIGRAADWTDRPRLIGNPAVSQEYLATLK